MDDAKIEQKFDEIKKMIGDVSLKLNNIDLYLNGQYGQKGLVGTVTEHANYINSDKRFKAQLFGGFTVITIIWGIFVKFWDKIFGD